MSLKPEWIYESDINPDDFYGFVYLITRLDTGRAYVGRKYLTAAAPKKVGVKRPARKSSNWEKYWGSCKPLLAEIEQFGHDAFKREIIRWCATRAETNYVEVEEQIKRDVLKATLPDGSRAYFNGNIMSRWYAPKDISEETRAKIAAGNKGKVVSAETREKMRLAKLGTRASADTKAKMKATHTGKVQSIEHRKAISKGMKTEKPLF